MHITCTSSWRDEKEHAIGEKTGNTPRDRSAEKRPLEPADDAQKRRRTTEADESDEGTQDRNEEGSGRRLIGKRHS